ncbi:hypothetical protein ACFQHV_15715 [Promicromonospora thailandica]|uniref:Uncharacterized protein n=1 Tax=Promicromonospora thailandica TaxID=765201 RepID=A0A9X2G2D3_9MICO|nr:hypothetical protein [Promicromonospora thailandica]MCP2264620.1 hypothetical protein [Promicromonospora thailandica]BFF20310.1 hypothetical protein GCM10025730_38310 [Promicromonospora thailandica]
MEQPPHNPDDDVPEQERLWPGEIDLTGAVSQDDALVDVIYDAISEVEGTENPVPEWGARTLARALANELPDPQSGALHRFAITGRVDKPMIGTELMSIYTSTRDAEIVEWIAHFDRYITSLPSDDAPEPGPPPAEEVPIGGTPLDQVRAYLRIAFAEADERGEPISQEDAQAIATMLGPLLPPDAAIRRFADTGETDPAALDECRRLVERSWRSPDLHTWAVRLQQYLVAHADASPPAEAPHREEHPQVAEGIREHGDAFRAFLTLPDTDSRASDLLDRFRAFYIGTYPGMDELLIDLTDIRHWRRAVSELEDRLGINGYVQLDSTRIEAMARETWDIVQIGQSWYVFNK